MRRYWSWALVVALATIVVPQAAASTASAAPLRARAVKAPGVYQASFPDESSSSKLVIKADAGVSPKEGTFQFKTLRDSGTWVLSGTTIALFVTSAPRSNHFHGLYIGTLSAAGISGGKYESPDVPYGSWSATRGAARPSASATAAPRTPTRRATLPAAGQYTLDYENGQTASFPVSNAASTTVRGTWEAVSANPIESGVWITVGNLYAMVETSGLNVGRVFIGTVTANGISNVKSGGYAVPGSGVHPWRAVRAIVCSTSYSVDSAHGSDAHLGRCNDPFKTLKKALTLVFSNQSIGIAPGIYDATNGETFPIAVPAGVTLVGDTAGRGASPQTDVAGEIDLSAAGSTVEGVEAPYVVITAANDSLLDDTVKGGSVTLGNCVELDAATSAVVSDDTITACQKIGVDVIASSSVQMRDDTVTANGYQGLFVENGTANLGTKTSMGHNVFSCNAQADLATYVNLPAWGNYFDHVPPTLGTSQPYIPTDVYQGFGSAASTEFAHTAPNPCT